MSRSKTPVAKKLSRSLQAGLGKVRMLAMDVDGVLTDAGMYYSESGDELKKFNTRDGMGIKLLRRSCISVIAQSPRRFSEGPWLHASQGPSC